MKDAISDASRRTIKPKPYVIGLTGPIASGKSTVSRLLVERGADLIDADLVYQQLITPGSALWRQIVNHFGRSIISENGEIDRKALGSVVFGSARALADLDRLTHPAVVAEILCRIEKATVPIVVIEAIKLFSSGLANHTNAIWLIDADEKIRKDRLIAHRGLDETAARSRVAAAVDPMPAGIVPDVSIANNGSADELKQAVAAAWSETVESALQRRGSSTVKSPKEDS
jgi:dephospho-CoA kinase